MLAKLAPPMIFRLPKIECTFLPCIVIYLFDLLFGIYDLCKKSRAIIVTIIVTLVTIITLITT